MALADMKNSLRVWSIEAASFRDSSEYVMGALYLVAASALSLNYL